MSSRTSTLSKDTLDRQWRQTWMIYRIWSKGSSHWWKLIQSDVAMIWNNAWTRWKSVWYAGAFSLQLMHLSLFSRNLEPKTTRLTALGKKSKSRQFWKNKKYEKEIQNIKALIASHIEDFTARFPSFHGFYVCLICSVSSSIITFPSKYW
jgi:hypothetical protein